MEFEVQLMKNYVKNVGGIIREIKTEKSRNSTSKTVYITIPKDAPYCSNLQKTFDYFTHEEHRLIARHYLRHVEHKTLPDKRKEKYYLYEYNCEYQNETMVSLFTVAIAALMIGVLLEFMGVITI